MIDVLMSTYNGAAYIEAQLDSILCQDFRDFRLLIRDDGSTDETGNILESRANIDSRISIVTDNNGNLGAPSSFMLLVSKSTAPYFMFADQDDVWLPGKINTAFEAILKMINRYGNTTPLAVFTDLTVVNQSLDMIEPSFWRYQKLDPKISTNWKKLLALNVVTGCTLIANAPTRLIVLPFRQPEMMHDLWVAAHVAKFGEIDYLPERTVLYRQHSRNTEGAKDVGLKHAIEQIPRTMAIFKYYYRASRFFGDVSVLELLYYKVLLNLIRLRSMRW